jgi:hypothetical protein
MRKEAVSGSAALVGSTTGALVGSIIGALVRSIGAMVGAAVVVTQAAMSMLAITTIANNRYFLFILSHLLMKVPDFPVSLIFLTLSLQH